MKVVEKKVELGTVVFLRERNRCGRNLTLATRTQKDQGEGG